MPEQERTTAIPIHKEVQSSFLDYAMSVIVSRALPDIRDGLKPVHRRILYAMRELGMTPDKPHKKSARLVGEVLGKYHPHGDQAVYDAMVRMAQDFTIRYPLVDGQGNFGSMDGDSPAAMRYTEARLTPLALEMLRDLDKETVDFRLNFDETLEEPVVLPSRFPNLLVNGSAGIAVGMATNIPPHNLTETIDALIWLIEKPSASSQELMTYMQGPDFPTGGIISGHKGIQEAYTTGRGRIRLRGQARVETKKDGREKLIITEIPYLQNKARLIERIAGLVREKKVVGITALRDESDRDGVRIVMEIKKGFNSQVILNQLYKFTPLQQTFGVIMLALVDDVPRVLPLRDFLKAYLDHQKEIITRRSRYLLRRARERAHLVEGLLIALHNIDRIIALIRGSADVEKARAGLMQEFSLSEEQARAILEMRLQRLTALERHKLEDEHRSLIAEIERLETLLADEKLILQEIRQDLLEIKKKYGDERRTKIVPDEGEINLEDLIEDEEVVITLTRDGYIKRLPLNTYRSQGRGGVGIRGHSIRESDLIENLFISSTKDKLLFFCSRGKVFPLKVYEIPEAGRQARGTAIVNLLPLENGEYITAVFPLREYGDEDHIIMVTQKGIVKRTSLSEYATARRFGLIAINLMEGDELITVRQLRNGEADAEQDFAALKQTEAGKSEEEPDICIATAQGLLIRFSAGQLRTLGRTARGVKGINLSPGDTVIGMNIVSPAEKSGFLFVTENGYAKRTKMEKFRSQNRGGKGLLAFKYQKREGFLVSFLTVRKKEEIMAITARGLVMRAKISSVPFQGRYARGVTLIRLAPEDKVVKIAAVTKD
ncbi:MAG: DNA gyrase subunit A [Firmicutes bacterium]|nr:DNA gyrase subunit A [Bacillota bacterium]